MKKLSLIIATIIICNYCSFPKFPTIFPPSLTTYTYDPLIGVTSITDPRGETIYYHYDNFNRLEYVKDAQGKILSENEYHYKNQQ